MCDTGSVAAWRTDAMRFFEFVHLIKREKEIPMKFYPPPMSQLLLAPFGLTFALFASAPARAADGVTLTVTAVAKKGPPPAIKKDDAQVFEGKEHVQATDWRRGET